MFLQSGQLPSDFDYKKWDASAIQFVIKNQLMGVDTNTQAFDGDNPLTRSQFASALMAYDKFLTKKQSAQVFASAPNPVQSVIGNSVMITVFGTPTSNYAAFGAGVFIDKDTILTAAHVVEDKNSPIDVTRLHVFTHDGAQLVGDASWSIQIYNDPNNIHRQDVAIIHAPNSGGSHLDSADPVIGEDCWTIGNPDCHQFCVQKGNVEAIDTQSNKSNEGNTYLLDIAAREGNSGGGVFNSDGKLIGILVAGDMDNVNFPNGAGFDSIYTMKAYALPVWRGTY